MPRWLSISSRRAMQGRRRSQSTRRTELPHCARASARLTAVLVLPSPALALATSTDCGARDATDNSTEVRKARYASDNGDVVSCRRAMAAEPLPFAARTLAPRAYAKRLLAPEPAGS